MANLWRLSCTSILDTRRGATWCPGLVEPALRALNRATVAQEDVEGHPAFRWVAFNFVTLSACHSAALRCDSL
jgi:hypothetical protein